MERCPSGPAASGPGPAEELLRFPDPARLEPDRAVQDLPDRAAEVLRPQGRLRDLLRAVLAGIADITTPAVPDHLVTAARDLLQARYAALAVLDTTGRLAQFLQTGADPASPEAIERCRPRDEGFLDRLTDAQHSVRIDDLTTRPAIAGWAPGPAPLRTFLGVPVRARGRTVGALCLGDKTGLRAEPEPFSDEDEELAQALARAAGLAIDNARLSEQPRREQAYQRATAQITTALLPDNDANTDTGTLAGLAAQATLAKHLTAQRADTELLARIEDHERIAQALRDGVIQHIFAISLTLNSVATTAPDGLQHQLLETVNRLDSVIKDIRATVLDLQHPSQGSAGPERPGQAPQS
ncbi:GAF domain-containing protein [Streptomyces sp. NPDC058964]|uniref:GAF domain-containing protein n=1 Tax=Streptomyces sp. NPDC058964 TaxID=3346681 RepID=UPI00368B9EDF